MQPIPEKLYLVRADHRAPGGNYLLLTGKDDAVCLYQLYTEAEYTQHKRNNGGQHG